jgi:uncharacterized membrane protein
VRYSGLYAVLLAVHLVGVVVLIGPLGYVTSTAGRLAREADVAGLTRALRTTRAYSFASLLVVVFGSLLVNRRPTDLSGSGGWLMAAYSLWVVAVALNLLLVAPSLRAALVDATAGKDASGHAARLGASGGLSALCWVVIVVLMIYKPGA